MKKSFFTQILSVIVFTVFSFNGVYGMKSPAPEKVPAQATQVEAQAAAQVESQAPVQTSNRLLVRLEALREEMSQVLPGADEDSDDEEDEIRAAVYRSYAAEEERLVRELNEITAPRTSTRTIRRLAPTFALPATGTQSQESAQVRLQNLNDELDLIDSPRTPTSPSGRRSRSPVEILREFRASSPEPQPECPRNRKFDCD